MTRDKAAKKAARSRADRTGESYTRARRAVEADHEGQRIQGNQIAGGSRDAVSGDQARWWRAYVLAAEDRVDELREHAAAGDDHARRQLAGWLSDRRRIDEAIAVIRPLADAPDEMAQLWLARCLAERGQVDELERRAGTGDGHALRQLAGWLADHRRLDELRGLLADHRELLGSNWGASASQHSLDVLRLEAELGDGHAQQALARWLARMQDSVQAGNDHARQALAEGHDEQDRLGPGR